MFIIENFETIEISTETKITSIIPKHEDII